MNVIEVNRLILNSICTTLQIELNTERKSTGTEKERDAKRIYYNIAYTVNITSSLAEIGGLINRDHASVLNGIKRCKELLDVDPRFIEKYDKCIKDLPNEFKKYLKIEKDRLSKERVLITKKLRTVARTLVRI